MTTLLNTTCATIKSHGTALLQNINLTINRGDSLAITGISGSGKSILGKLLSGISKPTLGHIKYFGATRLMVPQQDNFITIAGRKSAYYGQRYENTWMDNSPHIDEYLMNVATKSGLDISIEDINSVISRLDLSHLKTRRILQLSNGERKRTQLAAALIQKPDLLVLDQPFVGLDVPSRTHLAEVITGLTNNGITFIIICDPDEIIGCITSV